MNPLHNASAFPAPLTADSHQTAQAFYQQHSDPQKAKQVYLNTLSVQVVNFYLKCLGFETDLAQGESWNPIMQVLADIADLWVRGLGRLECRPVLPDMTVCTVPPETWSDRIGYVFVQFNPELTAATILGFAPTIETETLPIDQLQALDRFPDYLHQLTSAPFSSQPPVSLRRWLDNWVEGGWEGLETLLEGLQNQQPAFNFRIPLSRINPVAQPEKGVKQGKFLALGKAADEQVLFLVGIAPAQTPPEFNITVELYPTGNQPYLPRSLQLALIDQTGAPVLQAEGRDSEGLEFQFRGEPGERFSVKVSLHQLNLIETFEI